jgi:hypothetical protein
MDNIFKYIITKYTSSKNFKLLSLYKDYHKYYFLNNYDKHIIPFRHIGFNSKYKGSSKIDENITRSWDGGKYR